MLQKTIRFFFLQDLLDRLYLKGTPLNILITFFTLHSIFLILDFLFFTFLISDLILGSDNIKFDLPYFIFLLGFTFTNIGILKLNQK